MRHEFPYLSITHLDLADSENNNSKVITECILRQCALDEWETQGTIRQNLLWSQETEFLLNSGQLMVPRVLPDLDQNSRLNSLRRTITKTVSPSTSVLRISQFAEQPPFLQEEVLPTGVEDSKSLIRVNRSILMALNVGPDAFLFPSISVTEDTKETVVALSSTNSSRIVPLASVPIDLNTSPLSSTQ
jgi:hybrid polyketide synthase/nonribosomal peptide synthetase ACE1